MQVLGKLSDPLGRERDVNVKALFRRGKARMQLSNFDAAKADVREANQLDPASREVREMWGFIKEREKKCKAGGDEMLGKMTGKLLYRELNVARRRRSTLPHVWMNISIGGKLAGKIQTGKNIIFRRSSPAQHSTARPRAHGASPRCGVNVHGNSG